MVLEYKKVFMKFLQIFVLCVMPVYFAGCSDPRRDQAVELVKASIQKGDSNQRFYAGPLHGGTAVLTSGHGAYWVRNGQVHFANDRARKWSPGLPKANYEIDYLQVRMSVRGSPELDPLGPSQGAVEE